MQKKRAKLHIWLIDNRNLYSKKGWEGYILSSKRPKHQLELLYPTKLLLIIWK